MIKVISNRTKSALCTFVLVMLCSASFGTFAHGDGHGHHKHKHKHKHKQEVIVVKKYKTSPKHRPKHRHYHYKRMPKRTTYIKIGNLSYARVDGHYYRRKGDSYVNVIIK